MNDVSMQKKKLANSFLRISYYNSDDPGVQLLLGTSTIFIDEGSLYKKTINQAYVTSWHDVIHNIGGVTMTTNGEPMRIEPTLSTNTSTSATTNTMGSIVSRPGSMSGRPRPIIISKEHMTQLRLSSQLVVYDKYTTNTSSEGFYLYMFKEQGENLRERTIYLKFEFFHAGKGKKLLFYIPRKIKGNDDADVYDILGNKDEIKKGVMMDEFYQMTHLPVTVKYDFESKRYIYKVPSWLKGSQVENESALVFELFEIKMANEDNQ
jgi:hypothetical protein